jgi:nucleotide-binding universal stress UspA family protein
MNAGRTAFNVRPMFDTIIWPTDASDVADAALHFVDGLARRHGSRVVVVHATRTSVLADDDEPNLKIRRQVDTLKRGGQDVTLVVRRTGHDDVAATIASVAGELDGDVIVLATHGRGPVSGILLGSVARELLQVAPCPVLAVPPRAAEALHAEREWVAVNSDHRRASQDVSSL